MEKEEQQTIDYQAKGERLFTTGCFWTLAMIFLAVALTAGPVRDENGTPYADWRSRTYLGYLIIALLAIAPTFRRQTRVNYDAEIMTVCDCLLFVLPFRWKRISIADIRSIECEVRTNDDNRRTHLVTISTTAGSKTILTRSDEDGFAEYRKQAADFANRIGVELISRETKA
ncbi:MAG: hypothetical protein U0930_03900 [Pirellulales bacterium]